MAALHRCGYLPQPSPNERRLEYHPGEHVLGNRNNDQGSGRLKMESIANETTKLILGLAIRFPPQT